MINQQLLDYIRSQRSAGLSKEAITQALAAGGWTANDVNEAWMAIDGVRTPPPPPPPPAPVQNPPRVVVPPPGAQTPEGIVPSMPMSTPNLPNTARPIVAASEFSTAPVKKHRTWPWVVLILLFMIIIAGGVAYATFFSPGIIALPNLSR